MVEIRTLLKFGSVGISTAGVYFFVLAFFLEVIRIDYKFAVSIAYVAGVVFQFNANKYFTFQSKTIDILPQVFKFLMLLLINYLITILVVRSVVEVFNLTAYHGVFASIPIIAVVGYVLSKYWIFKEGEKHG